MWKYVVYMVKDQAYQTVSDEIDNNREEMVDFLLDFANKQSPGGKEKEASDFLYGWMSNHFDTEQQAVFEDRSNVIGKMGGRNPDQGNSLIFNAHMDTGFGDRDKDEWVTAEPHRVYYECWRDGDHLYGDDIANDKGSMAAFLWGALAIANSGIELENELYLAGVIGEIQSATVDEYQGTEYHGTGAGTRHIVTHGGITADCAVVAETTDYAIGQMECGLAYFKITFTDDVEYWPRLEFDSIEDVTSQFPGALHDASRAALKLHEWATEYSTSYIQEYEHGTNVPTAGIGAFRSGVPYGPGHAPGKAALYLTVFLPPGERPEFVRGDLWEVLSEEDLEADIELYNFARGYIADQEKVAPLVSNINEAHEEIRGGSPPQPNPAIVSMWRDLNVLNEVGIPAVTFGPSRTTEEYSGTKHRCMHVDDLVKAAKLYAYITLATCGITE
jgi:acetylornithine deacetylase/succinyl-diaminopimelate desuccinylase-like protein